jgi:uncharacterized protein YggE
MKWINTIKERNLKNIILVLSLFFCVNFYAQEKNFLDKPYIEVSGKADTLITPNRIYIDVLILEKDTKGKESVEDLEQKMLIKLTEIGINAEKDVVMKDMISVFKKYFLKATDIQKSKSYSILVYDALQTTKVFIGLEEIGISNVTIEKTEHSDFEKIQLSVNSEAIKNAKATSESYLNPLNQKTGKVIFVGNISTTNQLAGRVDGIQVRGIGTLNEVNYKNKGYFAPIEFEKIKISCEVGVRFEIE